MNGEELRSASGETIRSARRRAREARQPSDAAVVASPILFDPEEVRRWKVLEMHFRETI